ncbi:glycosyltransferase family 2 protein [Martelella mediterranea]|uniref:Nucleotidyltransferase-like protein n=1 Tax=Martelella mediterranea TaxID=293089 RepID=A0A4R3NWN8_9HYPH|nr:glycosyltransferase family 2 protein [Martelella mediterranea]TCT44634.1 nucleotidyltransferase-like protein [Martelella mediterranea]
MKIVVLMGGGNLDIKGELYPLYLAEFNEEIILERQIAGFSSLVPSSMIFCVRQADIRDFSIDDVIQQSAENATCVEVPGATAGSVCTALLAAEHIDTDEEIVLVAADELIDADFGEIVQGFRDKTCDAGVVAFRSVHPRYSFALVSEDGMVREVAEKRPVSRHALASFYYFRRGRDFVSCAQSVVRKDRKINNAFYLSQTVNEMILRQKKVCIDFIENEQFHPLKTEMQLAQYISLLQEQREAWLH